MLGFDKPVYKVMLCNLRSRSKLISLVQRHFGAFMPKVMNLMEGLHVKFEVPSSGFIIICMFPPPPW